MSVENIDEKIAQLPEEKRKEFEERYKSVSHNEIWLTILHNFSYRNFNEQAVRETLYREEYAQFAQNNEKEKHNPSIKPSGVDGEEGQEVYGQMFRRYDNNRTS